MIDDCPLIVNLICSIIIVVASVGWVLCQSFL